MNEQNTDILKKAFPSVYRDKFYFECADGWFELLAKAGAFINSATEKCCVIQAKEKFGSLRIYLEYEVDDNGLPLVTPEVMDSIYEFINHLEKESKTICEDCGTQISISNRMNQKLMGYWIRNVCKPCGQEYVKRHD